MYKFCYLHEKLYPRITKIMNFSPKFTYFLRSFCFRLVTAENESNNVHSEEDEEDSDDDDDVQIKFDKVVNTNTTNGKLLFVYQSPNMQRLYRRYGSSLIMLDATYRTTKYALPLFFMVVKTNVNYLVRHKLVYHGTLSKLYIPMFLTWNVHYLKLRRQKNIKNVVEVLGVGDKDSGVTAESLKSKNKLKPKKNIPYFEFSSLTECTKLVTY